MVGHERNSVWSTVTNSRYTAGYWLCDIQCYSFRTNDSTWRRLLKSVSSQESAYSMVSRVRHPRPVSPEMFEIWICKIEFIQMYIMPAFCDPVSATFTIQALKTCWGGDSVSGIFRCIYVYTRFANYFSFSTSVYFWLYQVQRCIAIFQGHGFHYEDFFLL